MRATKFSYKKGLEGTGMRGKGTQQCKHIFNEMVVSHVSFLNKLMKQKYTRRLRDTCWKIAFLVFEIAGYFYRMFSF